MAYVSETGRYLVRLDPANTAESWNHAKHGSKTLKVRPANVQLLTAEEDKRIQRTEDEDLWETVMRETGGQGTFMPETGGLGTGPGAGTSAQRQSQQHGPSPPPTTFGSARPGDWLLAQQGALRRAARRAHANQQSCEASGSSSTG